MHTKALNIMNKEIFSKQTQRKLMDIVGVDFSATSTKVVRLKSTKEGYALVGMDILPAVDFDDSESEPIELPKHLISNYACLTYNAPTSVLRVINTPLPGEATVLPDEKLRELLNVGDDFRVAGFLIKKGSGRQNSSFLSVATPEKDIKFLLDQFPTGAPAPASIEVGGLAFLTAFLHNRGEECKAESVCLIEAGESVCHYIFLNKGQVALVGKFSFGGKALREKVAHDLQVDEELADTILADSSIDISGSTSAIITPFLKQLSISKDFIERQQSCRIAKVYVSGGLSAMGHWSSLVEETLKAEVVHWSPLENIQCDPDVVSEELMKQAGRFSAAIGAAIGGLE